MEVQTTTVTELEARSVTELQEILNAAKAVSYTHLTLPTIA